MLSLVDKLTEHYQELKSKINQDIVDLTIPPNMIIIEWMNMDISRFIDAVESDIKSLSSYVDDYCIYLLETTKFLIWNAHISLPGFISIDIIVEHLIELESLIELGHDLSLKELGLLKELGNEYSYKQIYLSSPSMTVIDAWKKRDIKEFIKEINNDLIELSISVDDYCVHLLNISEFTEGLIHLMDIEVICNPVNIIDVLLQRDYDSSYNGLIMFYVRNRYYIFFKSVLYNMELVIFTYTNRLISY